MDTSEHDFVIEHILGADESLKIAQDVYNAYPRARERLIAKTMADLKKRIQEDFGQNNVIAKNEFREAPYAQFTTLVMRKVNWPQGLTVGFSAEARDGQNFLLGLGRSDLEVVVPANYIEALNERVRQGRSTQWWPWWYRLDDPYRNWNIDALVEARNDKAAPSLYAQLKAVAATIDFVLDAR